MSDLGRARPDEDEWRSRAIAARKTYLTATPWPHLVVDDLFDRSLVLAAEKEEIPRARTLETHKNHRMRKAESRTLVGPAAKQLLREMKSPAFIAYVEEVTGLRSLEPDPDNVLAGLHVSGQGSFQSVHTDFPRHPLKKTWHRANVLLYLNSSWQEDFGGDLELWPADMSACGARVKPTAGTVVIFETHAGTPHGIPDPIRCGDGRLRLSLAVYYYSAEPPPGESRQSILHRVRRPEDPWWVGIAEPEQIAGALVNRFNQLPGVRKLVKRHYLKGTA
jgi:Rps23 Pro-64 3,4-dihydroxylase Tpa1-like proline 4-hydroxylase